MHHRSGLSPSGDSFRAQFLEQLIGEDNFVRVIDAFIDTLDLASLGFAHVDLNDTGRPPYSPYLMLKLIFYCYFNQIRSSRKMERESTRNVELWWLIDRETPSYHTISTFRSYKLKDKKGRVTISHPKALEEVFKRFRDLCNGVGLYGKSTIAVDGTKIQAQNSKKKHISEEKLEKRLESVDGRIEEYLKILEEAKASKDGSTEEESILKSLQEFEKNKKKTLDQIEYLKGAKESDKTLTQICYTDPDARMLPINNEGVMQIAYNVQSSVDDLNCLIVDYKVKNCKDTELLSEMGLSAKESLEIKEPFDLLADKGYHKSEHIHECGEHDIVTYVAVPKRKSNQKDKGFSKEDFKYKVEEDVYVCPNNQILTTNGKWLKRQNSDKYMHYRCKGSICAKCPFKEKCLSTSSLETKKGRQLERNEFDKAAEENKRRVQNNRDKYKRRQAIVEHPFGTIKRSWGYYYTLLKGTEKVSGEMAIIFTIYNLRRAINILGVKELILILKSCFFIKKPCFTALQAYFIKTAQKKVLQSTFNTREMVSFGRIARTIFT